MANKQGLLTAEQIAHFDKRGYLHLSDVVPPSMLAMLKEHTQTACQDGYNALKTNSVDPDYRFHLALFKTFLYRITNFHRHVNWASLAVLGLPALHNVVRSLCGDDYLNTVDMLLLKHNKDGLDLPWHQDLIYPSERYRMLTIGLYLESTQADDGTLKLIPGSQYQCQDIDAMIAQADDTVVEVVAKAGDMVIHNPMLVHWSDRLRHQSIRRTLYYEFCPMALITERNWTQDAIQNRRDLMSAASKIYHNSQSQLDTTQRYYQHPPPPEKAHFSRAFIKSLKG